MEEKQPIITCYTLAWGTWVNHVIQPRSCITLEDNTSSQSLLKNRPCYQIVLPKRIAVESIGWKWRVLSSTDKNSVGFWIRNQFGLQKLFSFSAFRDDSWSIRLSDSCTFPLLHAQAWYRLSRYQAIADPCVTSRAPRMFHLLGVSCFTDTGTLFGFPGR